jgi:hypothetical protein
MNLAQAAAIVVIVGAMLAYSGLALWSWRTPNGPTWRFFCWVSSLEAIRCAAWLVRAWQTWPSYGSPDVVLVSIMLTQAAAAYFTCRLAFSFRQALYEGRYGGKRES